MVTHKEGTSLPWVHAAYYQFKNRLHNFARMVNLEPRITQVLLNQHDQEGAELVRPIYLPCFTLKKIFVQDLCPQSTIWFHACDIWALAIGLPDVGLISFFPAPRFLISMLQSPVLSFWNPRNWKLTARGKPG